MGGAHGTHGRDENRDQSWVLMNMVMNFQVP
jgi:hypothetical protein